MIIAPSNCVTLNTLLLGVFIVHGLAPPWATSRYLETLEPAARGARVVCLGALLQRAGQTVGFVFPKLSLLSQGEPHVTKTTNL